MPEEIKEKKVVKTKSRKKYWLVVGGMIVLGILYFAKGLFVVAMVNGQPISRYKVIRELETKQGQGALDSIITEALIMQEARRKGVSVLPKEIDLEIGKLEEELLAQGQELDQVLGLQSMDRSDLERQVRLQKIVEEIFVDEIDVSDEEIDEYLETYGESFPEEMSDEERRDLAREQLKQQKLGEKFYAWIEELKAGADISYFVEY